MESARTGRSRPRGGGARDVPARLAVVEAREAHRRDRQLPGPHVGFVISGQMTVRMDDGEESDVRPPATTCVAHPATTPGCRPRALRSDRLAGIPPTREGLIRRVAGRDRAVAGAGWSAPAVFVRRSARGFGSARRARPGGRDVGVHRDVELRLAVLGPLRVQPSRNAASSSRWGWPYRMCRVGR